MAEALPDEQVIPKMNADLKARWLEALRSGRYKQGANKLRTGDDCFCCLGVLADVLDPAGWVGSGDNWAYGADGWSDDAELIGAVRLRTGLPFAVMNRCMELNDGTHKWDDVSKKRVQDSAPQTFAEIADYLEATV